MNLTDAQTTELRSLLFKGSQIAAEHGLTNLSDQFYAAAETMTGALAIAGRKPMHDALSEGSDHD